MSALSSWAIGGRHAALRDTSTAGDDDIKRLAIALGAIRSVVRVMDSHYPPMSVEWAESASSYTDFDSGSIRINPAPMVDKTPNDTALDVTIGFGMHEAGHSEDSRSIYDMLLTKQPNGTLTFAFKPVRVAAYLWNIVEDIRMEAVEARKWPGFAPYFGSVLDWMWTDINKRRELPDGYGDTLKDHLTFAFVSVRYPEKAKARWGHLKRFKHDNDRTEMGWWQAWRDRYLDGTDAPAVTIQQGLDHLAGDPEVRQELQEMTRQQEELAKRVQNLRDLLLEIIEQDFEGVPMPCTGSHGDPEDQVIGTVEGEMVRQLVREGLAEVKSIIPVNGRAEGSVQSRKPEEDSESREAFVGAPDATAEALRAALVFRSSAPQWSEKLLKAGEIDDEELHRWGADDYRVFSQKVVESKPDVLMGLLVDLSGSMSGRKLQIAQRLAVLFVHALHDQVGVETRVWGHTADNDQEGVTEIATLWEPGDPMSRFGLITTLPHGNNADGHAIGWCANQMRDALQPQKVLFVLSDGRPSAREYRSASEGERHVIDACRWARGHGIEVIQIAIDPHDIRPQQQELMFGRGNWVGYESDAMLPRQLADLMSRFA